jgi:hypothetical protein
MCWHQSVTYVLEHTHPYPLPGRNDSEDCCFDMENVFLNFCPFNCIAVKRWQRIPQLFSHFDPPVALFWPSNRQLKRRFALRPTPYPSTAKQMPTQGLQLHFLQQSQLPLQQYTKVVSPDGKLTGRLRGPKLLTAQAFDAKLIAQFPDPVLTVPAPVVATPHRDHTPTGGQSGDERLKTVAGTCSSSLPMASGRSLNRCRRIIIRRPICSPAISWASMPGTSVGVNASSAWRQYFCHLGYSRMTMI